MNRFFEINENAHNIRCKLYYNDLKKIGRAIIFCHGFGGHKDNKCAERFAGKVLGKYKDVCVVTFDWPCHGDDVKKKLFLSDCDTYLSMVLEHVKNQYGAKEFFAYGTSFGGYLILRYLAAYGNPFRKIALRCPAVNMYETMYSRIAADEDIEKLEKGKEVSVGFDRKIMIRKQFLDELHDCNVRKNEYLDYADDILILHGTKDEIVNIDEVREFADENVIEFIPIERADHRFSNLTQMDEATKYILEFFFKT